MFGLGPTELIIIAVIVLLIFGGKRLPEIGKGVGGAIREFRNVKKELTSTETADKEQGEDSAKNSRDKTPTLEAKVVDKVLEQVPGVKKVMDVKRKADKVKELLK
jgi:sec-independent protein translocase protein TatA